jgi:F-type H+-transporting ATPase subunit epsilon
MKLPDSMNAPTLRQPTPLCRLTLPGAFDTTPSTMAEEKTFACSIITPEAKVFDGPASFVALPAHDGEMGVLRDRAPLVCKLSIGILRLTDANGKTHRWFVDNGFAQMHANHLNVLTRRALAPEAIDPAAEYDALEAARHEAATDEPSQQARQDNIARARTKLRLANAR